MKMKNIPYGEKKSQLLDIYLPDESDSFKTMLFFHGGALEGGSKEDNQDAFNVLIKNGIAVVSANYSLYPEAKYPEFIEDAALALRWTFQNINAYGRCEQIFVAGSSAGAYLAMMLCFDKRFLGKHGIDPNDVAGFIFDAAQPTTHFNVLRERGLDPRSVVIDEAAPIYHIKENNQHPPMLVIVADHDLPNRMEQTMLFLSTLKHFNYDMDKIVFKIMKGYEHCEYCHVADKTGKNLYGKILQQFIP